MNYTVTDFLFYNGLVFNTFNKFIDNRYYERFDFLNGTAILKNSERMEYLAMKIMAYEYFHEESKVMHKDMYDSYIESFIKLSKEGVIIG